MKSVFDHWDIARVALGVLIVACNWGVWRGVALEESSVPWDRETGKRLLVRSLALEFFFAMMLLVIDTVGSINQKAEILVLSEKAGEAEQHAETAIKQANIAKERLAKLLNTENELERRQSELMDALTPPQLEYGKFSMDLAGVSPVPIVIEAEPEPNSQLFARDLDAAFRQARWPLRSIVNEPVGFIPGIWVKYLSTSTDETARKVAQAVCRALNTQLLKNAELFGAMTLEVEHERFRRLGLPESIWQLQHESGPGALDWPDSAPSGSVVIHIGPNRNGLFFNRARVAKGMQPLPDSPTGLRSSPCEQ